MIIDIARSYSEVLEALDISLRAFYPTGVPTGIEAHWKCKWLDDPSFALERIFLMRDGTRIVGGLRTIERTLWRGEESFRMVGNAEIFMDPAYQGKGLTVPLVSRVILECRNRGYDVMTCIARKKIDHFYSPVGLWGLGSYQAVSISGWPGAELDVEYQVGKIDTLSSEWMNAAYEHSYQEVFGRMTRTPLDWAFLFKKAAMQNCRIYSVLIASRPVAYWIQRENRLVEFAAIPGSDWPSLLRFARNMISSEGPLPTLEVVIPNSHVLFDQHLSLDVCLQTRECYFGGHLFKILNPSRFAESLRSRLVAHFRRTGVARFSSEQVGIRVRWDGSELQLDSPSAENLDYQQTVFLTGASTVCRGLALSGLPVASPFSIGWIDEF